MKTFWLLYNSIWFKFGFTEGTKIYCINPYLLLSYYSLFKGDHSEWWQRKLYFFLSNSCNIFRQNQVPGNDVDKPESKYIQVHSYGYLWPEINLGQLRYLFADFEDIEFAAQIYLVVWE